MPRDLARRRKLLGLALAAVVSMAAPIQSGAQGVELASVELQRGEGALLLSYDARLALPRAVESALLHGVPVYFVAQATLYRNRWYWRDERVARVQRSWRVAYQPLTASWRVGMGGFSQAYGSLSDALSVLQRVSRWRLAELNQIDPDARHYVDFSFKLDSSQLPSPMQIGLGGQGEWHLGIERTLKLDAP